MANRAHAITPKTTLAILAGGTGGRLGGTSKALLRIGDRTFLERIVTGIGDMFGEVLVGVKDERQEQEILALGFITHVSIVKDIHADPNEARRGGAILGLQAILARSTFPHLFLVSGDMPLVSRPVVDLLARELRLHPGAGAVVPRWGTGYLEPTLALYRVDATRLAVDQAISTGTFQLVQVIRKLPGVVHVPISEIRMVDPSLSCMVNVNDPDDLAGVMASHGRVS